MTKKMDVYKCGDGIVVEVLKGAKSACTDLQCCGKPMELQSPNTVDAATEKHVPILEEKDSGVVVKVGSVPHPMTEEHSIVWVEVINGDYVNRKYLNPGDTPEAAFYVSKQEGLIVRAYCNLHGLWEAKL